MAQQDGRSPPSFRSSAEFFQMPKDKYTFRYGSEDRSQGTIKVKIRVNNYVGPVKAVLGCVTAEDTETMPHPNKIMCPKRRKCKDGVCTIQTHITEENNIIEFNQIGIERVLKGDVKTALRIRTSDTDYPYARGYDELSKDVGKIDRTRVRFACQVLILDAEGKLNYPLNQDVISSRITHYPEKLKIIAASHDRGDATGGLRVFLFTAKLPKSVVVVFRKRDSTWQAQGSAVQQHKKVALQFTTPPYENPYDCVDPVKVYYFMATDNEDEQDSRENRRDFTYLPITDEDVIEVKRNLNVPVLRDFDFLCCPSRENRRDFTYLPITDEDVIEVKRRSKSLNMLATTISRGVITGDNGGGGGGGGGGGAGGAGGGGEAVVVGLQELLNIPRGDLFGDIAEHQHAQYEDRPISPDRLDFWNRYQPQAEEVHRTARNNLEQRISIEKCLLDQYMDVDVAGSENLPW